MERERDRARRYGGEEGEETGWRDRVRGVGWGGAAGGRAERQEGLPREEEP